MTDVVVTVPMRLWDTWLAEGDLPGDPWSGDEYDFYLGGVAPRIRPGERVYIVAHGKVRGFAPLVRVEFTSHGYSLVRRGDAVAVTIKEAIRGFQGWRYVWWERDQEVPFPDWRIP